MYDACYCVIITFSSAFTARFIPVSKSPFHCFYEQLYPHFTCGQHISHIQSLFSDGNSLHLKYQSRPKIRPRSFVQIWVPKFNLHQPYLDETKVFPISMEGWELKNPPQKYFPIFMHTVYPLLMIMKINAKALHFLGCPFLTRPLRAATVMSSCWICSSSRARLHNHNSLAK